MRRHLEPSASLLDPGDPGAILRTAGVTVLGFALYGFTVGFWRSPLMGAYVAIKMPLLIAATLACNGFLNGLLGRLLGSGLGFRQSLHALLCAFAVSALILGSIAPVTFFMALNAPTPDSPEAATSHASYLLAHTLLVAIAGSAGVMRLGGMLRARCGSAAIANRTLIAWIAGNAFLGAQFSWILRPFFGTPTLEVAFLREHPMRGNFYEAVWRSVLQVLPDPQAIASVGFFIIMSAFIIIALRRLHKPRTVTP